MITIFHEAMNELKDIALKNKMDQETLKLQWINVLESMLLSNALQEKRSFKKEDAFFKQLVDDYTCSALYPQFSSINHYATFEDENWEAFYVYRFDQESNERKAIIYRINLNNLSTMMLPILMKPLNQEQRKQIINKLIVICESFQTSKEELEANMLCKLFVE